MFLSFDAYYYIVSWEMEPGFSAACDMSSFTVPLPGLILLLKSFC